MNINGIAITDILSKSSNTQDSAATTRINNFDDWTNSEENYNKTLNGEKVEDFKMFDFDVSTYSSDLKEFSQEYIDKYDADNDKNWNYSEFVNMATNSKESAAGLFLGKVANSVLSFFGIKNNKTQEKAQMYDMFKEQFSTFSFDDNAKKINSGELASVLYSSDLDLENYAQTGDVASSIDGQLNYANYQTFPLLGIESDSYKVIQGERADFYDAFYGNKEDNIV